MPGLVSERQMILLKTGEIPWDNGRNLFGLVKVKLL